MNFEYKIEVLVDLNFLELACSIHVEPSDPNTRNTSLGMQVRSYSRSDAAIFKIIRSSYNYVGLDRRVGSWRKEKMEAQVVCYESGPCLVLLTRQIGVGLARIRWYRSPCGYRCLQQCAAAPLQF